MIVEDGYAAKVADPRLGASLEAMSGRLEWFADKPAAQLSENDVGKFVDITSANIPEAFQQYYAEAAARGDTFVLKGGCKGLQVCVASIQCLRRHVVTKQARTRSARDQLQTL